MCNRSAVNYQFLFYFCYFVHFLLTFSKKGKIQCAKSTFLSILKNGYIPFLILRCTFFTLSPKNKSVRQNVVLDRIFQTFIYKQNSN